MTATFSLASTLRNRKAAVLKANTDYQANVILATSFATSVVSSNLPALKTNPSNWNDFVSTYQSAKDAALDWSNSVYSRLSKVPGNVQGYNEGIMATLADAQAKTNILIKDPSNKAALDGLKAALDSLSSSLNSIVISIKATVDNIEKFDSNMPQLATDLQSLADTAAQASSADKAKLDDLKKQVADMQSEIDALAVELFALSLAAGVAITLGLVATFAAFPVGAVAWFVMAPIAAVAVTYIALDSKKIIALKDQIAATTDSMDDVTADIAVLDITTQNYANLVSQSQAAATSVKAILVEWQTLETEVNDALTTIKQAISDVNNTPNYQTVLGELTEAQDEWLDGYNQAGNLLLNVQVDNADLVFGMSSAQVQTTLDTGTKVELSEYLVTA